MKQLLNQLLEWVEFAGYFIVICKSNDLGNKNLPILFDLKLQGSKSIPTGEPEKRYYTDYVIVDSNKDGIPELHIRSGREFRVFSYKKGEIVNTYSLFSQIFQYTTQNDGTFLYYDTDRVYNSVYYGIRRDYYRAFQVDKGGNEHIESEFYWMDLNENAIYDKDDQYFVDEEECMGTEWINLTNKYIYINEGENAQGHADLRDEVEWTIYCEAVRSNIPVEQTGDVLPDTVIGSLPISMTTDEGIVDKTDEGYIVNIYNDENRAVWKTLKKWADEQESWVNGEALLDYEIMRLDNDLFSILLSGEWNPEDGEIVFTGESEKDSCFGYFVERKSANVYTAEGEWRGECYFDLLQIYYIVSKAEIINKGSKKEIGKFFDGLAE